MIRKIKILLVDDHIVVRNGIKLMLSQQKSFIPEIVEAVDAEEVIQLTNHTSFDVILLDINLPGQNGISITKYLTKKSSNYKILALTMHKEEYMVKQMISAGAMGYLLKNTGLDELTKAIMTVASSNKYYCNEASQVLINDSVNGLVTQNKQYNLTVDYTSALSNREKEVMMLIVKELSSVQIAEKLLKYCNNKLSSRA